MSGIPLNYVIWCDKPKDSDPIVGTIDDHECLMYQVRLKGTEFYLDNRIVYIGIQNATEEAST